MRTVTIIATKGGQIKKYQTDATTWGDLRMLIQEDYSMENLKATENINKTTLEHIDSVLPEGDFRVFLRPSKTKSGGIYDGRNFKEMRSAIADEGDKAKKFLSAFRAGKNWTQLTTADLILGMNAYASGGTTSTSAVVETPAKKKAAEKVADVVGSLPGSDSLPANYGILSPTDKCKVITEMLNGMLDQVSDEDEISEEDQEEIEQLIYSSLDEVQTLSSVVKRAYSGEVDPLRVSKTEQDEIDAELRELEEGF